MGLRVSGFGLRDSVSSFRGLGFGCRVCAPGIVLRLESACTQHSSWQEEFLPINNTALQIGPLIVAVLMKNCFLSRGTCLGKFSTA